MSVKPPVEIIPETFSYVFSPYREPIAHVAQGQRVIIHCEDAFESRILSTGDLPSRSLADAKVFEPTDRPDLHRGRRTGRCTGCEYRGDRADTRLRRQLSDSLLWRTHVHLTHAHAAASAGREGVG